MIQLPPKDAARVEKLVAMLASEYEAERSTAATMIVSIARRHGLSAVEMLCGPRPALYSETVRPPWEWREPAPAPAPEPVREDFDPAVWRELPNPIDMLAQALRFGLLLTDWERKFAADLITRQPDPALWSAKQRPIAVRIIQKARTAARAAGAAA